MKKSRQIEYQKLQRKDRKEKKDSEKFSNQIKQLEDQLLELKRSEKYSKENDTIMEFETITAGDIIFGRDSIEKKIENQTEQSDDPSTNIVSVENGESTNVMNDDAVPKSHETENTKGKPTKITLCASDSDASKINTNIISAVIFTEGM